MTSLLPVKSFGRWMPNLWTGLLVCCLTFWTTIGLASDRPLSDLVGADVGVCVEIRNLKTHLPEVLAADWFQRLSKLEFVKNWKQGPEFTKLQVGKVGLEAMVGQPLNEFFVELFGDSVLLAITPTADGKPVAVLLSRAEKDDSWEKILRLWDQLESHDVQTQSAFGRSLQRRRKKIDGKLVGPDIFTSRIGRILALSDNELAIRNVLARSADAGQLAASPALSESESYQQATAAVNDNCLVRVVVNARAWDAEVQRTSTEEWAAPLWRKVSWLASGIDVTDGVTLHSVLRYDGDSLPEGWQKFVAASQPGRDLAARLPSDCFIAGELRINPRILNWLRQRDSSEQSQRDWKSFANVARGLTGRDLVEDVLPKLGPSIGIAVIPSRELVETDAPVDGLLTVGLAGDEDSASRSNGESSFREALDGAFLTLWNFGTVSHNSRNLDTPLVLKSSRSNDQIVRWLEGVAPYRPAYGLAAESLAFASDPRLIQDHWKSDSDKSLTKEPLFAKVRSRSFPDHGHWVFVHSQAARQFLAEQHDPLSRQLAHWRKLDATKASRHLTRLQEMLTPFDAVFVASKVSAQEIRITTGFVTSPEGQ